ncbi:MAG: ATP-binding protein, partial [candidate division WOR-3 bacterium]
NARDAMPEGGELYIKTEKVTIGDSEISGIPYSYAGEFVCLTVSDTGIGMSEEELSKIFAPFYTTKENGTGLGLSVVQEIIKKHEGWINVESEPGKGSAFKICIPLSYEEEELKNKSDVPLSELRGAGETILIVEDEEITRTFLSRVLKENGYSIFEADSIEEAKRIFEKNEEEIKMVFSDVILADGSGLAFVEELFSENQNIRILLSSGYISDKVEILNVAKEKFDFLEKPYDVSQLLRKVKEILA